MLNFNLRADGGTSFDKAQDKLLVPLLFLY